VKRTLNYQQFKEKVTLEKIREQFNRQTGARRGKAGIEVNEHGLGVMNVAGSEIAMSFFDDQGVDPLDAFVTLRADKLKGLITMHAAQETDEGAVPVPFDADKKTYSIHYGSVLQQFPTMRPAAKVQTSIKPRLDGDGKPCLAIQLQAAKTKRRGAADPETLLARAEEEAAKKAAKAEIRQKIAATKAGATTRSSKSKVVEPPPEADDGQDESEEE